MLIDSKEISLPYHNPQVKTVISPKGSCVRCHILGACKQSIISNWHIANPYMSKSFVHETQLHVHGPKQQNYSSQRLKL